MPRRSAYTAAIKLLVVKYSEEHGKRAAGRHFGVDESNVRLWCRTQGNLNRMNKAKKAARFRVPKYPEVEKKLLDYVVDHRAQGLAVSTVHLRLQAKLIAKDLGIDPGSFTASPNWCYGFMRRNDLSVRRRTHISQKLPADHEDKLLTFQQFVIKRRKELMPPLSMIGNAGQTPHL